MADPNAKQLVVEIKPQEHLEIKLAATKAGISIKKYVRLKLGLDAPEKGKK
jgi:predicted HicB family RNase H-like nuclease